LTEDVKQITFAPMFL